MDNKRFAVQYRTGLEEHTVSSFSTFIEAVDYVTSATRGQVEAKGNPDTDQATAFQYVIYDLDKSDLDNGVFDVAYASAYFWE